MTFSINRFIGKCFYIISQCLVDAFALLILNAYYIECVLREALLYHVVEFTIVFEFSIYTLIFLRFVCVRYCERDFDRNGFELVIIFSIESLNEFLSVLIMQPEEQSIVPQHVEEQEKNEGYGYNFFHGRAWGYCIDMNFSLIKQRPKPFSTRVYRD